MSVVRSAKRFFILPVFLSLTISAPAPICHWRLALHWRTNLAPHCRNSRAASARWVSKSHFASSPPPTPPPA